MWQSGSGKIYLFVHFSKLERSQVTWIVRTEDLRLHTEVRHVRPGFLRWGWWVDHDLEL